VSEPARAERAAEDAAPTAAPAAGPRAQTLQGFVTHLQRTAGNRAVGRLLQREAATEAPATETWSEAEIEAILLTNRARTMAHQGGDPAEVAAAKRAAIVKLAMSQVGKVEDRDRGDHKKVGAERLKEFYRVAYAGYNPSLDYGIEHVGLYAGMTDTDRAKKGKPWSWCAIFGVWAIRSVTGIGSFAETPIGLGPVHFFKRSLQDTAAAIKPGDMIIRKEPYEIAGKPKEPDAQDLNHQCLVASIDSSDPAHPTVTTVNGNGEWQRIHVRTEPLSYYKGWYDSLSQTNLEAFEKELGKWRRSHALPPI
jgi:hypothetical protein